MTPAPPLAAADRLAIEALLAAYHWSLDVGDVDAFADTLIADGVVELVSPARSTRFEGHAGMLALAEGLRQWDRFPGCQHLASQVLIETLAAGRCRVRSYCAVVAGRGEPPFKLMFAGRSDDVVVRLGDRWLFERRQVHPWTPAVARNDFIETSRPAPAP